MGEAAKEVISCFNLLVRYMQSHNFRQKDTGKHGRQFSFYRGGGGDNWRFSESKEGAQPKMFSFLVNIHTI